MTVRNFFRGFILFYFATAYYGSMGTGDMRGAMFAASSFGLVALFIDYSNKRNQQ